jgi:Response regulator containing CheY-like receiver, AAA-type ATPase, and DNA-binding domains
MSYSWSGNIRGREGVIEKAVLLEEYDTVENIELLTNHSEKPHLLPSPLNTGHDISSYDEMQEYLDNIEKEYFIKAFKKHKGRISDIAEFTGLNRRTISNKMKKFSIKIYSKIVEKRSGALNTEKDKRTFSRDSTAVVLKGFAKLKNMC